MILGQPIAPYALMISAVLLCGTALDAHSRDNKDEVLKDSFGHSFVTSVNDALGANGGGGNAGSFEPTTDDQKDTGRGDNTKQENNKLSNKNWSDEGWPDEDWPSGEWSDDNGEKQSDAVEWRGFSELALGVFSDSSPNPDGNSLAEWRNQLAVSSYWGDNFFSAKVELLNDDVDDNNLQLRWRELYVDSPLGESLNLRLGQQVLTWGTGDFVFLNDFFPKDWQSMFSGRDDEYLKAPSASAKLSFYSDAFNADVVWTPQFHSDIYIRGERFSYGHPAYPESISNPRLQVEEPSSSLSQGQLSIRLSKTHNGVEYAGYFYRGLYTQPNSVNPLNLKNYFASLRAYGASLRAPFSGGIANAELSYWQSRDDRDGRNPWRPNSQFKALIGFEREVVSNFTLGAQLFSELTLNYGQAKSQLISPIKLVNRWHHNVTLRMTYLSMQQKLNWSLFAFYSPDEGDMFLKPKLSYRHNDQWSFSLGANEFRGEHSQQQWGQFSSSSNVYFSVRFSF